MKISKTTFYYLQIYTLFIIFLFLITNFQLNCSKKSSSPFDNTITIKEYPRKSNLNPIFDSIIPKPQYCVDKGENITIDNTWSIIVDTSNPQYNFSAYWLKNNLSNDIEFNIIDYKSSFPNSKIILLGTPSIHPFIKEFLYQKNQTLPSCIGEEGYILDIFNNIIEEIIIAAFTPNGVFYGIQTLIQLYHNFQIRCCRIIDYPDQKIRGNYYGSIKLNTTHIPYTLDQKTKDFIDWIAGLKFNSISLCDNGLTFLDESRWKNAYEELFNYCRERFIEPIPRLCSISTTSPFNFEYIEGWYVENESMTFDSGNNAIPDNSYENLLLNGNFETDSDFNNIPDDWIINNYTGATWTWDNSEYYSGSYSMRLDVPNPVSASTSAYLRQDITNNLVPTSYYFLHGYVKAENNAGSRTPQVTFYALNGEGQANPLITDSFSNTGSWKEVGLFLKTPDVVQRLTIYSRIQYSGTGTIWLDNFELYRISGSLRNVIRASDTDFFITDPSSSNIYIEGIDYSVVNGTTSKKFSLSLTPFEIHRIPSGSIPENGQILVDYDAVYYYDLDGYWWSSPCLARDEFYTNYIYPGLDGLINYYHPKIINIDADEIRGTYRDSRTLSKFSNISEMITYYINKVDSYVRSKDPGCRIWIWDDMVSPVHNGGSDSYQLTYGGNSGRMAESTEKKLISKNVIMDIWWYERNRLSQMFYSVDYFNKKGYEIMGSPYDSTENIIDWAELLMDQPHSLGAIVTTWGTPLYEPFRIFIDHNWNTRYRLVIYDSFEEDLNFDNCPDNWNKIGDPLYLTDGSESHGSRYVNFPNCNIQVNNTDIYFSNFIQIKPNTDYNLSAFIKRASSGVSKANMTVKFYTSTNQFIEMKNNSFDITEEYEEYQFNFTSPSNSAYIVLYLQGDLSSNDNLHYDIIRLKEKVGFIAITYHDEIPEQLIDQSYSIHFFAEGGLKPYSWNISQGFLPEGMSLSNDGIISGEPLEKGVFNFSISVLDNAGNKDSLNISFIVNITIANNNTIKFMEIYCLIAVFGLISIVTIIFIVRKRNRRNREIKRIEKIKKMIQKAS